MKRTVLMSLSLLVLLPLAACNRPASAPQADANAPATPAADAKPSAAAEAAAAAANSGAMPTGDATAADASTPNPAADAAVDAVAQASTTGTPVAGTDYVLIQGGQPYAPLNGKIEVVEVFGYVCPACAAFNPLVSAWKSKLPKDVRFTYVPAPFGTEWNPYAKAFYVADSMNLVDRSHDALIKAIHVDQTMPGEGDPVNEQAIADFYGKYGANPKEFLSTMNSFTVAGQVNRGRQFMIRTGANSTPTLIVNGKYRVMGDTFEAMLRNASALIARERAATGGMAPAKG